VVVKLPEKILEQLDDLVNNKKVFTSRSEAIRYAIVRLLVEHGYTE